MDNVQYVQLVGYVRYLKLVDYVQYLKLVDCVKIQSWTYMSL